jgi:hypothetical protein
MRTKISLGLVIAISLCCYGLKAQTVTPLYNFEAGTTQAGTYGMAWPGAPYITSYAPGSNPSATGINASATSLNLVEVAGVNWWDNLSIFTLTTPTTITNSNRYLHIMYRTSNIAGGGFSVNLNTSSFNGSAGSTRFDANLSANNTWQDIVIDLNYLITNNIQLSSFNMNPDLNGWGSGSGGTYNFDEIILSSSPLPRGTTFLTGNNLYDFESGTSGNISGITTYSDAGNPVTYPVTNPYQTYANQTTNCGKRSANSSINWWVGFVFSFVNPVQIDIDHKYLHVMVIAPTAGQSVAFDIKQGATTVIADNPNTINTANVWQDVVIDVSSLAYISGMSIKCGNWDGTAAGDYYYDEIWIDGDPTPRLNAVAVLNLTNNNPTMGSVSGAGTFTKGVSTTVTATPNTGYRFVNWTENGSQVSTVDSYTFAAVDRTLVANFASNTINLSSSINSDASLLNNCTACDITIADGGSLNINTSKSFNTLTVAPSGKLTLNSGQTLSITGAFTLQSDATGTGTFVDNTTTSPQAINGTVQQYVTAGRNWYVSIPLTSTPTSVLNKGTSVLCYDEQSGTFISPPSGNLTAGRGYISVASSSPTVTGTSGTIDFTGSLNTGNVIVPLTRHSGVSKEGFNLVGNPYPSYLDFSKVDTTTAKILSTIWYRTKTVQDTYTFDTYNSMADIGTTNGSTAVTKMIPPMQAFWVRVKAGQVGGTLTFTNAMRAHIDNSGNRLKVPAANQSTQQILRLQVSNGINSDEAIVLFNPNASNNLDNYDSPKMSNNDSDVPEIYTTIGNENLVINGMNSITPDQEIPLVFKPGSSSQLTIKASVFSNFDANTRILLRDYLDINNVIEKDLTDGVAYSFASATPATTANRFTLVFKSPSVTTGENNNNTDLNISIFRNGNGQITVSSPIQLQGKTMMSVYNALGQKLETRQLTSMVTVLNKTFESGVYFVNVIANGKVTTQKVIIN